MTSKQQERLKLLEEFKKKKEAIKKATSTNSNTKSKTSALKSNTTNKRAGTIAPPNTVKNTAGTISSAPKNAALKPLETVLNITLKAKEESLVAIVKEEAIDFKDEIASSNFDDVQVKCEKDNGHSVIHSTPSVAITEKENLFDISNENPNSKSLLDQQNSMHDGLLDAKQGSIETDKPGEDLPFLETTLQSAVNASKINVALAREIFHKLKAVDFPSKALYDEGVEVKVLDKPWKFQVDFWLEWARVEEEGGAVVECEEVFAEAAETLTSLKDLAMIRQEYNLFQERLGQKYSAASYVNEEEDVVQFISETPIETYLQDSSIPTDDEKDFIPYIKPELESTSETVDTSTISLVNMLSDLNLKGPSPAKIKVKVEDEEHIFYSPLKSAKKSIKPRIGVPINVQGSSVTVLTPIKASKKLQSELGVESVITPVRRSLRFHDDDDYTSSAVKKLAENDGITNEPVKNTKEEKVKQLLEEHEFAYVPNKVFSWLIENVQVTNIFGKNE